MKEMQLYQANVNEATIEELTTISGIGESLAKRIIDKRPFKTLKDLINVSGINETKLDGLLPYLTLGKKKAKTSQPENASPKQEKPIAKFGNTEAFVFFENRNEQQDALLIVFGGFIIGLIILLIRRSNS